MLKESLRQYLIAFLIALGLVTGVVTLAAAGKPVSLRFLNLGLASGSITLLGLVLLLGPLSRLYARFDRWLVFRKELGVLAFWLAAVHLYLVMFPLARSGPLGVFKSRPLSAYPGLASFIVMALLMLVSINWVVNALGKKRWWQFQYWGARLAFILAVTHLTVLRFSAWKTWLASSPKPLPPTGLITAVFAAWVILVRLSEPLGQNLARKLVPLWTIFTLATYAYLFLA
ncbi:MAG: putative membrane protein fused with a rieske [2Fe-2S]-like protein [Candidatus Beckwithbacteria bacterium GW2011_GWB1_47_15]|uniref:Putative membrane protein fused with a rieske [2Fe-2S]-like protein n=1 Tax=Candidatus Beckwithbacteria bacterium GW2011_GWB1_47_15 TaxID=1618371 RepID=A0A0G1RVC3_9BACT|nr:MAG: hypothetical protein UY43_C0001G0064 [Candidatus Beckwithbacteria bacterium GW2011_GWC1_49_16]KKU35006.1 MAG: putative membrane protein fused with a rieske [2Fe-2S]-like protein [Candidatus Beckwithbacteria bacterium GW2011_GWA1_46_30]KKU61249.1 MAG: putative membrane protein fused with a rieske [2Fe-2S]-like protein [Candidatus Beckwithbacteria bacterium GW2011_GWB1_47_15]KKU71457.1 MAG: putative membrane protein fused with a rieske [2Fe-2S]-like protein [Candidatus Beckwithbacteria bac